MRGNRPAAIIAVAIVLVVAVIGGMVALNVGPFSSDQTSSTSPVTGSSTEITGTTSTGVTAPPVASALPLGTVETTNATLSGAAACTSDSCQGIQVTCPGVDPLAGFLGIQPPQGKTTGVMVLFSGGDGRAWWADEDTGVPNPNGKPSPAGTQVLTRIEAGGIEVVQVKWPDGWIFSGQNDDAGLAAVACRPSTVVKWVYDNIYKQLGLAPAVGVCGFCIAGSSGGASQAAYALSHYGLDGIVNGMILTSGPPHAALAKGCSNDPSLAAYHYDLGNVGSVDPAYGFDRHAGAGPCAKADPSAASEFERDGVDTGGSDYVYETTRVVVLLGDADPTVAPVHAQDYIAKLQSAGTPILDDQTFPGMVHSITSTKGSQDGFVNAVLSQA